MGYKIAFAAANDASDAHNEQNILPRDEVAVSLAVQKREEFEVKYKLPVIIPHKILKAPRKAKRMVISKTGILFTLSAQSGTRRAVLSGCEYCTVLTVL